MRANKALRAWREQKATVGGWLSIGNAYTAEVMANLGFDWLCVDLQHGLIDYQDLTAMLPAISTTETTPIVRVPWNEPYEIMKALDAGAYGVIVPMVNNREEALRAVSACRYPPLGLRSFGPIRAALYGGRGYSVESNGEIACIVMIETAEALENLARHRDDARRRRRLHRSVRSRARAGLCRRSATTTIQRTSPRSSASGLHVRGRYRVGIHTSSVEYTQRYLVGGLPVRHARQRRRLHVACGDEDLRAVRDAAQARRRKDRLLSRSAASGAANVLPHGLSRSSIRNGLLSSLRHAEVVDAPLIGLVGVTGDDDHRRRFRHRAGEFREFEPRHLRHRLIGQDQRELADGARRCDRTRRRCR